MFQDDVRKCVFTTYYTLMFNILLFYLMCAGLAATPRIKDSEQVTGALYETLSR